MQIINKDAYGGKLYVNFGRDISAATTLTLKLQPEVGADIGVTPTLETSDAWVGDEQFDANQFVSYTITDGMFDNYVGRYRAKATATVGSTVYSTEYKLFEVTA